MRIGHGFDIHAFGGEGPIVIGGVHIPFNKGLLAYSDGDVVLHAIIDALLGAAALGDIGRLFPNNNPKFKGIDSCKLLKTAWNIIQNQGHRLGNIDVTIIAQVPKISPYIPKMRTLISQGLNCYIKNVNIKATTTENLGFIGKEKGIACEAVALLVSTT